MRKLALILCGGLAACGGGSPPASPGPPVDSGPAITISGGRVSPQELTVPPGTRVLFVNSDARPHNMTSDPHPEHSDCPEINQVGLLNSGQRRETGNLVAIRTCGFHDHDDASNANLRGRITVR